LIAAGTVVANAAIVYATVSRHERIIEELRDTVHELKTEVAILRERLSDK
jgi:SepF-like predicted cell division protein (DUF552 family)